MSNSWVCVDASLVIKLVVEEAYSAQARTLWRTWLNSAQIIAAPPLLRYEITSVLCKQVARKLQTVEDNQKALDLALSFDINYLEPADFHRRAAVIQHGRAVLDLRGHAQAQSSRAAVAALDSYHRARHCDRARSGFPVRVPAGDSASAR